MAYEFYPMKYQPQSDHPYLQQHFFLLLHMTFHQQYCLLSDFQYVPLSPRQYMVLLFYNEFAITVFPNIFPYLHPHCKNIGYSRLIFVPFCFLCFQQCSSLFRDAIILPRLTNIFLLIYLKQSFSF